MRAAEHQGVDILLLQFLQIARRHFVCHAVVKESLLDEWHKHGAGFLEHADARRNALNNLRINFGVDCAARADHADAPVFCGAHRAQGARVNHPDHRDFIFLRQRLQGVRTRRVAGNHNRLHTLRL